MPEYLLDELRSITRKAIESQQPPQPEKDEEVVKEERAEDSRKKTEMRKFVREELPIVIEEIIDTAQIAAGECETSTTKEWRIKRLKNDQEPTDELDRTRALAHKVAEHFIGLNFRVEEVDTRDGYEDPRQGPDGLRDWIPTDHLIGVRVSWAPIEEPLQ